ncbi:MAG: histidinol-phosphatase HisJ family protein [Roseburia sp.]|nr:histidinol-phosphatase HisJ family protein [Roseburia sp.]
MTEFVEAAVAAGMEYYGFTPHSPLPIESSCNMHDFQVPDYLAESVRLKKLYSGRITLFTGMEIDYLSEEWGPATDYFRKLPLDYRIGSVHFIPSDSGPVDVDGSPQSFIRKVDELFAGDIRHVVTTYFRRVTDMLTAGCLDIVGHYDKIWLNARAYQPGIEELPWFRRLSDQLTDAVIESGVAVEINTKTFEQHGFYSPDRRHWKKLKESDVTLLVNSDAHFVNLIDIHRRDTLQQLALINTL